MSTSELKYLYLSFLKMLPIFFFFLWIFGDLMSLFTKTAFNIDFAKDISMGITLTVIMNIINFVKRNKIKNLIINNQNYNFDSKFIIRAVLFALSLIAFTHLSVIISLYFQNSLNLYYTNYFKLLAFYNILIIAVVIYQVVVNYQSSKSSK